MFNLRMHTRYRIVLLLFVFSVFVGFFLIEPQGYLDRQAEKPKNIILISIDTLRADSMGFYGYGKKTTPNIDFFSKEAVIYDNAYTQIPATYPSFASLMTGLTPFESGIYSNGETETEGKATKIGRNAERSKIDEKTKTLAMVLKENKYFTKALLTNVVLGAERTFLDNGFDEYRTFSYQFGKTSHDPVEKEAIEFITQRSFVTQPFFLWIHFLDPHSPYTPSIEQACQLDDGRCSEFKEKGYKLDEWKKTKDNLCQGEPLSKDTVGFYKFLYDGEIAMTDESVGRILAKVDDLGLDENTIIVIYGDHGESFEHGLYFEHLYTLYEPLIKVPLIIFDPESRKNGSRNNDYVVSSDLYSIILNKLDIKSAVAKKQNNQNRFFSMNSEATKFAIRRGNYKYIYSLDRDECSPFTKKELYDLKKDPKELVNLAESESALANVLHQELIEFIEGKVSSLHPPGSSNFQSEYDDENQLIDERRQKIIDDLKSLGY
jgi:arylsulfatase